MRIRNPVYLPFALLVILFLALANHHGWSLTNSLVTGAWRPGHPATQHK